MQMADEEEPDTSDIPEVPRDWFDKASLVLPVAKIIERLKILEKKLDDEGRYVSANTCWLAYLALADQLQPMENSDECLSEPS